MADSLFTDTLEDTGLLASLDRLDPGLPAPAADNWLPFTSRSICSSAAVLSVSGASGQGAVTGQCCSQLQGTPLAASVPKLATASAPAVHGSTLFGDDTLLQLVSADDLVDGGPAAAPCPTSATTSAAQSNSMPPPPAERTTSTRVRKKTGSGGTGHPGAAKKPARGRRRHGAGDRSRLMTTLEFTATAEGDTGGADPGRIVTQPAAGDGTNFAPSQTLVDNGAVSEDGSDGQSEEQSRMKADTLLLSRDDSLWTMTALGAAVDEAEGTAAAAADCGPPEQLSRPGPADMSDAGPASSPVDVRCPTQQESGSDTGRNSTQDADSVPYTVHPGSGPGPGPGHGHGPGSGSGSSSAGSPPAPARELDHILDDETVSSVAEAGRPPSAPASSITAWDLPDCIVQNYTSSGLRRLYDWQAECLRTTDALAGGNLVYSAPTSSGKTLVAEILLLRKVTQQKRKAIVVVPFVSLAREKTLYLQSICSGAGVRVSGFYGGQAPPGGLQKVDVAVCTIEKANNLVNRLIEERCLHRVGCVVTDELHLLGDPRRGYLLEVLLTKLLYMNRRTDSAARRTQLIGMSATLPNLELLSRWLSAQLYVTDFRPVPLRQYAKLAGRLFDERMKPVRPVDTALGSGSDPDLVLDLVLETVTAGHGVLVFCPTKAWCEQLAVNVAAEFCRLGRPGRTDLTTGQQRSATALRQLLVPAQLQELLDSLRRTPAGLDPALARSVAFGVAFHHAGLTVDERDLLELSFRRGALRVLVATSTLSSGVNLPARRVIIRSPLQGGALLDLLTYRQMIGRAGRTGTDTHGESVLVCRKCDRANALHLMTSQLPPITSCLTSSSAGGEPLKRAVLEVIVSGAAVCREDVALFASCTLSAAVTRSPGQTGGHGPGQGGEAAVEDCLGWLIEHEFVRCADDVGLSPTQLGSAALASSLGPSDSLAVIAELQRARRCFVLESELHLVYLVTPVYCGDLWPQMDWLGYLTVLEALPAAGRRVAELVSVEQRFIVRALKGTVNPRQPRQAAQLAAHKRFFTALALHELINEAPLRQTAEKFGCNRGALQALQQSAATFAGMVTAFCARLGWRCLELLLDQFQSRLEFGVHPELVPLVRLSLVNGLRARALRRAGLERLIQVANSSPPQVEAALRNATPFQSATDDEAASASAPGSGGGSQICVDGCRYIPVEEAARDIVLEARKLVESDLGMTGIAWGVGEPVSDGYSPPSSGDGDKSLATERKGLSYSRDGAARPGSSADGSASPRRPASRSSRSKEKEEEERHNTRPSTAVTGTRPDTDTGGAKQSLEPSPTERHVSASLDCRPNQQSPAVEPSHSTPADRTAGQPSSTAQRYQTTSAERRRRRRRVSHALFGRRRGPPPDSRASSPCLEAESPEDGPRSPAPRQRGTAAASAPATSSSSAHPVVAATATAASSVAVAVESTPRPVCSRIAAPGVTPTTAPPPVLFVTPALLPTSVSAPSASTDSATDVAGHVSSRLSVDAGLNLSSQSNTELFDSFELGSRSGLGLDSTGKKVTSRGSTGKKMTPGQTSAARTEQSVSASADKSGGTFIYPANSEEIDFGFDETKSTKKLSIPYDQIASANKTDSSFKSARDSVGSNLVNSAMFEDAFTVEQLNLDELSFRESASPVVCTSGRGASGAAPQSAVGGGHRLPARLGGVRRSARLLRRSRDSSDSPAQQQQAVVVAGSPPATVLESGRPAKRPSSSPLFGEERRRSKRLSPSAPADSAVTGPCLGGLTPAAGSRPPAVRPGTAPAGPGSTRTPATGRTPPPVHGAAEAGGPAAWPRVCEISGVGPDWDRLKEASVHRWQRICLAPAAERVPSRTASLRRRRWEPPGLALRDGRRVTGIAVLAPDRQVLFLSLDTAAFTDECLQWLFALLSRPDRTVILHQCRRWLALLPGRLASGALCRLQDPSVAVWLLDPASSADEVPIHQLVRRVSLPDRHLVAAASSGPDQQVAVASALLAEAAMDSLEPQLKKDGLWEAFTDVEMPSAAPLAALEQAGMPVDGDRLQAQIGRLQQLKVDLERQVHRLAGRRVSLASGADVGRLLFCDLGLPTDPVELADQGSTQDPLTGTGRGRPGGRGLRTRRGRPLATNREALLRIRHLHPVIDLVIEWRKLTHVITMIALPLQREAEPCSDCAGAGAGAGGRRRVLGRWVTHTATGRVTMQEPSLQTVPRDFSITGGHAVSLRSAFVASVGCVLVSADYCQLELRLLAHLSGEPRLQRLFRRAGDPFRLIAAAWTGVSADQVTEEQRQHTKAVCYGLIYGMGQRTLAAHMSVSEERATELQETFHQQFPGIRPFLAGVVTDCARQGYVTTLAGRRRYLPDINSASTAARGQAERQAVNTTVQGSAADLVKRATNDIYRQLCRRPAGDGGSGPPQLVLQLHDELIYEVREPEAADLVVLLRSCMRAAASLAVPLEVKVKQGASWDRLVDLPER